jgi:GPH family glycoside/pentoside/hexuronide:cation symporter
MIQSAEQEKISTRPFGMRDQIGYMIGNIGNDLTFAFAGSFFMVFYSNLMGVSPALIGTLFGVARLVDAFTDIGMGAIVDNSKTTKNGKFRPWLKRMAIPVGVASIMMYNVFIIDWPLTTKIIYMFIVYLLWGSICYTAINIPYGSLASVITADPEGRAKLSTFRSIGSMIVAAFVGFVVPSVIYTQAGQVIASNFFWLSVVLGSLAALSYFICYKMVEERVELPEVTEKFSFKEFFSDLVVLFQNRGFLGLMLATMLHLLGMMAFGQLMQYLFIDYFQDTTLLPYAGLAMSFGGLAAAPFVGRITKRFGKKEAGATSLIVAGLLFIVTYFLSFEEPLYFVLMVLLINLVMGYFTMAMYAYVTDVIDDYQITEDDRKDGTIYSVYSFIRKVGQALAGFIAGASLTMIGFQEAVGGEQIVQTTEVSERVYALTTLIPGLAVLAAGLILLFLYPLGKDRVDKNQEILKEMQ